MLDFCLKGNGARFYALFTCSMNVQTQPRSRTRVFKALLATEREVLLARLLLRVCDELWTGEEAYSNPEAAELYNAVKSIAEGLIRGRQA